MKNVNFALLYQNIVVGFNSNELTEICFKLGIVYKNLEGDTLKTKVIELIEYCNRNGIIELLIGQCKEERPNLDWNVYEPTPLPPPVLPSPTYSRFIERPALDEVVSLLRMHNPAVLIFGMGGIGKTSMARRIAQLSLEKNDQVPHFEHVVWVDASVEGTTFDTILNTIARAYDYPGLTQEAFSKDKENQINWLLQNSPALLIVDNIENMPDDEIFNWIGSRIPFRSKVILLSRQQHKYRVGIRQYHLGGMHPAEANEFIEHLLAIHKHRLRARSLPESSELIEATDGNPFAIEITFHQLGVRGLGALPQLISELYACKGDELFEILFARAWESLDENSRKLFMLTTLFPDTISETALSEIAAGLGIEYEPAVNNILILLLISPIFEETNDTSPDANSSSEANLKGENKSHSNEIRYISHPLCKTFASKKLAQKPWFAEECRRQWLEWIIAFLSDKQWPWNEIQKLDHVKEEEPFAYAAINWAASNELNKEVILIATGLDHYYYVRGHWDKKAIIDELRIKAANAEEDFAEEALSIAQNAQMLSTRAKAEDLAQVRQKHLPRLEELEKTQKLSADTITAIRHAKAFFQISQHEYDDALLIFKEVLADDQHKSAKYAIANRHWLAYCLYKDGQHEEANGEFEKALQEAIKYNYLRSIAFCKRNLAEIALDNREYDRAKDLIEDAYKQANSFKDRRYLAQCELVLARLYIALGSYEFARSYFELAEDRYKRLNLFTELQERKTISDKLGKLNDDQLA